MKNGWLRWSRRWLILPPLVVGVAVLAIAIRNRQGPARGDSPEIARALRVVRVQRKQVTPMVVGYGLAQPARTWRAIAEVEGRVVRTHPRLDPGEVIAAATELLQVDPKDYELRLRRLESQTAALAAQLRELEKMRLNNEALLEIERQALELASRDLERNRPLIESGAVSRSAFDSLQGAFLTATRRVQDLTNALTLLPAQIARLEAEQDALGVQMEEADRDLDRTRIAAPFACQLARVEIETGQYVGRGETLFEVHGLDASEVEARIPLEDLQLLLDAPQSSGDQTAAENLRGRDAVVRVRSGTWSQEWAGQVVRVREQAEQTTRTVGVVVRISWPDAEKRLTRPPLLAGTFCEVQLSGIPRADQLVVPRVAVRQGRLHVVDPQDRLASREVTSVFHVEDLAVVTGAIAEGERVVISDPTPSVEGMLIRPILVDPRSKARVALSP